MSKKAGPVRKKPSGKTASTAKTFVLFGTDPDGKSRGMRLTADNENIVGKAARTSGLRVGIAAGAQHADVLSKLPVGRLPANGKDAVPIIPAELLKRLNSLVGGDPGRISTAHPRSRQELVPGNLVIAQESPASGWFEAVVTKRDGDMLTLVWRDYPSQGAVVRNVKDIALLCADQP